MMIQGQLFHVGLQGGMDGIGGWAVSPTLLYPIFLFEVLGIHDQEVGVVGPT